MKKRLSFILTVVLIFSVSASPIAYAQTIDELSQNENALVGMPVVDAEGNYMGTVTVPSDAIDKFAVGAYITFKGIQALVYNGYQWVCTHPEETIQTLQFLIDGFTVIQDMLGLLQSAIHDGTDYVSAENVGGDLWACRYSI